MSTLAEPRPALDPDAADDTDAVLLRLAGHLAGPSVPRLDAAVAAHAGPDRLVVVDVADLEVDDHDGLAALEDLTEGPLPSGGTVVLLGLSAAAKEVIRADRRLEELRRLRACA